MSFWCWFWAERNANFFTLFTVLLSGIISWIISAAYYRKGNRTNLKMSVVYPIIELIGKPRSFENYKELCILAKEYSVRYMNRREQIVLKQLTDAYNDVARYDEDSVNADILLSYFEETVRSYSVDFTPVPVTINGEIVDYEPPVGYFEIQDNIYRIIKQYNPNYQHDDCQEAIENYFVWFCNTYYPGTKIVFFKTCTLDTVLRAGEIREKWRKKFHNYRTAKEEFLALPVVKSINASKEEDNQSIKTNNSRRDIPDSLMKFAYSALYQVFYAVVLFLLARVYFSLKDTKVFSIPYASDIVAVIMGAIALGFYQLVDWVAKQIAYWCTKVPRYDSDILTRGEAAVIAILTCVLVMGSCAIYGNVVPDLLSFSLFLAALVIVIFQQTTKNDTMKKTKWKRFWSNAKGIWIYIVFMFGSIFVFVFVPNAKNTCQLIWTLLCVLFAIFDSTHRPNTRSKKTEKVE